MQLNDLTSTTLNTLFGRLLRRALGAALLAVFVIVALYYASGAGTLALTDKYGMLYAYLIMAAIYAAFALTVFIVAVGDARQTHHRRQGGRRAGFTAQHADRDADRSGDARLYNGAQDRRAAALNLSD